MEVVLLDTNAYTAYRRGDREVFRALSQAGSVLFSFFVYAELLEGFRGGTRDKENRNSLEDFLAKPGVRLAIPTIRTAEYFAIVKNRLRAIGRPIPLNDVWIAAQCLEHGALLLTMDAHFDSVEGLRKI
ncbi:MAG: type II toxin-antitoxin system VapC family toxin [Candidatus Omnitrophica bacterium]|nr:type II toxin-antitoxin system VapC family toxin [Candidatus Omnitrophota bacterium]MCA9416200.1 type II toxin-antitoxin system VapC family toxin [Candidatus Omnitrophota bacterium]MCA9424635.1 type II toxin-antitoxin system VapC family toxin [Candidatus Omnitrophota bacterium]MCA9432450.1 type II toxin-antitoxin system VapC family toxin [Candidatus Omnitrophota bacterium]MCA9441055.1 type II toxin-antitoxin system VapC family toxin [Candidatus Omnitrophota bacterium]